TARRSRACGCDARRSSPWSGRSPAARPAARPSSPGCLRYVAPRAARRGSCSPASESLEVGRDLAHVREGLLHPGQRIVLVDLVLEVDVAVELLLHQLLEDLGDGHLPLP